MGLELKIVSFYENKAMGKIICLKSRFNKSNDFPESLQLCFPFYSVKCYYLNPALRFTLYHLEKIFFPFRIEQK